MTMECNKDDALLAKKKAEERFSLQDFVGAKNFLNIAKRLFPSLEGLEQMLAVVDVHITALTEVAENEMDWYAILQVDPSADDISIKKQYRKLALTLHPDKNKAFGAEAAFKLIGEALRVLSDKGKRSLHDMKRNITNGPLDASTFWTACPICKIEYQYPGIYRNCELLCRLCRLSYVARDIDADGKSTHIWTQYYANIGTNVDYQRHYAHNGMANCAYTTGQKQVPTHRTPGYDTACGAEFVSQTYKNVQSDKACKYEKEWKKQELRRGKEAQTKAKEEEKRKETELKRREAQRKSKEEEKRRETELKEREAQKKAQEEEKRRETELKRSTEREAQKKAKETELKQRAENEAQRKVKEQKRREAELKRRPEKKAQQKAKEEEKQRETKLKRRPGKEAQKKVKEEEKSMQTELKQRTGEEVMEEEKKLEKQFIQRSENGQREIQKSVTKRSRERSKRFKNREEEKNAKGDDIEEHVDGECYTEETFKAKRRRSSRVRQNISYKFDGSDDDFDEFPAKKVPGITCKGLSNENANKHKRRKITINIGIVPKGPSVGKSLSNGKIQKVQLDDNSDDDDNDNDHTSSKALEEALMLIKSRLLTVRLLLTFSEKPLGFSRIKVRGIA